MRLDAGAAVRAQAGVAPHFPDDAVDAAIRADITLPALSIFTQPWN